MADAAALIIDVERSHVDAESSFGLITAFMSVAAAIYKAPAGVFAGHRRAYYVSVVSCGIMGLAEACAAVVWLSSAADDSWGKRLARRCVRCASLLPLAFMAESAYSSSKKKDYGDNKTWLYISN